MNEAPRESRESKALRAREVKKARRVTQAPLGLRERQVPRVLKEIPVKLGGMGELSVAGAEDLVSELAVAPAMERLYERLTKQGG